MLSNAKIQTLCIRLQYRKRVPTNDASAGRLLVLNGPNLNLLGLREPEIYGATTLAEVEALVTARAADHGFQTRFIQSNHEGVLLDAIHAAREDCVGIIANPGAYSHTSVALRDAFAAAELPLIEVHISNIHQREDFRHFSFVSAVASTVICGAGIQGYDFAVDRLALLLGHRPPSVAVPSRPSP